MILGHSSLDMVRHYLQLVKADAKNAHRRLVRTTNGVERLHREVRRRARVVSISPNQASCLRLASAVLNEISDEWLTGRTYLTFQGSD